jgi:hypothetical protein
MTDFLAEQYVPQVSMRNSDASLDVSRSSGNVPMLPQGAGPKGGDNAAPLKEVTPVFDSRPFNAQDIYFEYKDQISYQVPAGYNMILRQVAINSYQDDAATLPFIVEGGLNLVMAVDGVNRILSDPNYGLSSVFDVPTFATIKENSLLTGYVVANANLNPYQSYFPYAVTPNVLINYNNGAFGNNTFLMESSTGNVIASRDLVNWSNVLSPGGGGIAFNGTIFMAVRAFNVATNAVSFDGYNWQTLPNPGVATGCNSMTWGAGLWVAFGTNIPCTSFVSANNGQTWTQSAAIANTNGLLFESAFAAGKFLFVNQVSNLSWYSADGLNWTQSVVTGATNGVQGLVATPNGFRAVGTAGAAGLLFKSADGINWTSSALPNPPAVNAGGVYNINCMTYVNGALWYMSNATTNMYYSTDDGATWTAVPVTAPVGSSVALISGNGQVLYAVNNGIMQKIYSRTSASLRAGNLKVKYAIRGQLIPSNGKPDNTAVYG